MSLHNVSSLFGSASASATEAVSLGRIGTTRPRVCNQPDTTLHPENVVLLLSRSVNSASIADNTTALRGDAQTVVPLYNAARDQSAESAGITTWTGIDRRLVTRPYLPGEAPYLRDPRNRRGIRAAGKGWS